MTSQDLLAIVRGNECTRYIIEGLVPKQGDDVKGVPYYTVECMHLSQVLSVECARGDPLTFMTTWLQNGRIQQTSHVRIQQAISQLIFYSRAGMLRFLLRHILNAIPSFQCALDYWEISYIPSSEIADVILEHQNMMFDHADRYENFLYNMCRTFHLKRYTEAFVDYLQGMTFSAMQHRLHAAYMGAIFSVEEDVSDEYLLSIIHRLGHSRVAELIVPSSFNTACGSHDRIVHVRKLVEDQDQDASFLFTSEAEA